MTLNQYASKANAFATYNKELGPYYTILGLCGEAGEVANSLKKVYRDNNGVLTKDASKDLAYELGDVLWYLAQSANQLGLTLEQVAELNIAKLYKKQHGETLVPPSMDKFTDNDFANYLQNYEKEVLKDLEACWVENVFEFNNYQTHQKFIRCVENTLKRLQLNDYQHKTICDETNNSPDVMEQEKVAISLNFRSKSGYYYRDYVLPDDFAKIQNQNV